MSEEFSPQDYYTRDEAMGILQITAMELGELISKGVLKGVSIQGKSSYAKAEVEYYFHCLENIDYTYEPSAQPYLDSVYQGKAYSSLNTLTLLGINEFELDFLIRSRLLIVFYRGFNWFFSKLQVDECVANMDLFRRDMESAKRYSATRIRPVNAFVWVKPDPKALAALSQSDEPPSTEDIKAAMKEMRVDEEVEEIPFEEPSQLMYKEEEMEVDEVLEMLDIEEHELDLLIAEKSLKHYLEKGILVFHRIEVQRYFERLKTQNLVCAEENMEELFEALEDGVYSFRETRVRLFLTEFQMELLERSGALTVFKKGIHRYFNRTKVDDLEGDPNAFAQLIVSAKRAGLAKKKIKKKKVFPYTKHYRTRRANTQFLRAQEVFEVKESKTKSSSSSHLTLNPIEEEIVEISPLLETKKIQPTPISPVLEVEEIPDTSALLPPLDTSALLPPEEGEMVALNLEEILSHAQECVKIKPSRTGLIPQTRGTTFTYTQTKIVLQMGAKEIQTLMQQGKLTQLPQKKSVHFEKEEVLALRQQLTSLQIEEF